MNLQKAASTAKKLGNLFKALQKIVFICTIVLLCVLSVLTIAWKIDPTTVIGTGFNQIDIGPVSLTLAPEHTPDTAQVLIYIWLCTAVWVLFAGAVYTALRYVRQMLEPIANGQPFDRQVSDSLKNLAYTSLVLGAVDNLGNLMETLSVSFFGLNKLLTGSAITAVTTEFSFDLTFVIGFFILMLLSYIFSYGAALQQLSDETL